MKASVIPGGRERRRRCGGRASSGLNDSLFLWDFPTWRAAEGSRPAHRPLSLADQPPARLLMNEVEKPLHVAVRAGFLDCTLSRLRPTNTLRARLWANRLAEIGSFSGVHSLWDFSTGELGCGTCEPPRLWGHIDPMIAIDRIIILS